MEAHTAVQPGFVGIRLGQVGHRAGWSWRLNSEELGGEPGFHCALVTPSCVSQTPHLVNLNEDPLMSECLLYYIKDGITR